MCVLARIFLGFLFVGLLESCDSHPPSARTQARPRTVATPQLPVRSPVSPQLLTPLDTVALLSQALGEQLSGYAFHSFTRGDLNQDKRPDFIVLLRSEQPQDSTTSLAGTYPCRVALVLNQGFPHLALAAVNDNLIECLGGCPYQRTVIKGTYFSFESMQGDCSKTYSVQTFQYSKRRHNWFLYKESDVSYSCQDSIPQEHSPHERTSRDFGLVTFANATGSF
jgi:hypothetical protein